jgi:hypothetical protein
MRGTTNTSLQLQKEEKEINLNNLSQQHISFTGMYI